MKELSGSVQLRRPVKGVENEGVILELITELGGRK